MVLGGGIVYKGQVKNSFKHGKGVQTWPNGAKYEGDWDRDKMCGSGKYYYPNGDFY